MKHLFFFFLSVVLISCSDFKKKEQLAQLTRFQKEVEQLNLDLKKNKIDTIARIGLATSEVELRIKNNLKSNTIDMVFGKKMDDYKRMRRSFAPLGGMYQKLKKEIEEERTALMNLKTDIQNGEGERKKYPDFISFESNKIMQLKELLKDYTLSKNNTMQTFFRLHPGLDSLSRALIKP